MGGAVAGTRVTTVPGILFPKHVFIVCARDRTRGTMTCLGSRHVIKISARAHPSFGHNAARGMTLLRVSARSAYFLFHLGQVNVPSSLRRFLVDSALGVNLSLGSSFGSLQGHRSIRPSQKG